MDNWIILIGIIGCKYPEGGDREDIHDVCKLSTEVIRLSTGLYVDGDRPWRGKEILFDSQNAPV